MQLVDAALAESDQFDAVERQVFVEGGGVGLVARDTVESLGNDDVEYPRDASCRTC